MSRPACVIFSTKNLEHNLSIIQRVARQSRIIAMVKANAYGHGLRSVALRLEKHVFSLGVASIDEALELRKVGIKIPITLMEGVFEPEELRVAASQGFHVVFHSSIQIQWLQALLTVPFPIFAWLKIDSGMGRLGFSCDEALQAYQQLNSHQHSVKILGCMSHLACADDPENQLNQIQFNNFSECISQLPGLKSMCNSAAIFAFPDHHYDVIRPGLALYGISPFNEITAKDLNLKPVMTLHTRLISLRVACKGSTLGYGARFVCPEDMLVGVIAVGYGDGYPRSAQDGTPVLVNGIRCQLVGRVSMDMITVDLRPCPHAKINDLVTLWGEGLSVEEVASYTHDSPYNIVTSIQSRVKCTWTE